MPRTPRWSRRHFGLGGAVTLVLAAVVASAPANAAAPTSSMFVDTAAFPTIAISVVVPRVSVKPPKVLENGLPVKLLSARDIGRATVAAIVLDHSRSMRGVPLHEAVGVAKGLLADRNAGDRMAVFAVASKAEVLAPFSTNPAAADKALSQLTFDRRTGTQLYQGIVLASDALKHEPGHEKVIFVLSDGQSTDKTIGVPEAATAAAAAGAAVYPITIDSATYLPRRLRALSRATSGAFLGAATRANPADSAGIASDVRRTWRLEYQTDARAGQTVTIQVEQAGSPAQTSVLRVGGFVPQQSFVKKNLAILVIVVLLAIIGVVVIAARGSANKKARPTRKR
jgi:hypothetical protein